MRSRPFIVLLASLGFSGVAALVACSSDTNGDVAPGGPDGGDIRVDGGTGDGGSADAAACVTSAGDAGAPWAFANDATALDTAPALAVLRDETVIVAHDTAATKGYVARLLPTGERLWQQNLDGIVRVKSVVASDDCGAWLGATVETSPAYVHVAGDGTPSAPILLRASGDGSTPGVSSYVAAQGGGLWMVGNAQLGQIAMVTKTDAAGKIVWAKTFPGLVDVNGAFATSDGGLVVVGDVQPAGVSQAFAMKLTATGDIAFARSFGDGIFTSGLALRGGGMVVVGYRSTAGGAFVAKLTDAGAKTWGFSYEDGKELVASAVTEVPDGVVVGGHHDFAEPQDAWAMLVKADGTPGWSRAYGVANAKDSFLQAGAFGSGVVLAGETSGFGGTKILVSRLAADGTLAATGAGNFGVRDITGSPVPIPGTEQTVTMTSAPIALETAPGDLGDWGFEASTATQTAIVPVK